MLLLVTDPGVYAAAVNTYLTMSFLLPRASNGNIFRVTVPLCGEFTGDR